MASPYPERLVAAILKASDAVTISTDPIDSAYCRQRGIDWIVAYGFRHLIRGPLLDDYRGRIVNLHIALLPWNRGADPNFWSWYDDTPKGVTIHFVDAGIDTGDIVVQESVEFSGMETLRSSYDYLCRRIEMSFAATWSDLRTGRTTGQPQPFGGTFHRQADKEPIFRSLPLGWDTPVADVRKLGLLARRTTH